MNSKEHGSNSQPKCPLCESSSFVKLKDNKYEDIWTGLKVLWGASFTPETIARHSPAENATLGQCGICGLEYFFPSVPGDAEFYRELSKSPTYYNAEKWEFDIVAQHLTPEWSVLDVGCGEGRFVGKIKDRVKSVVGIDTNAEGIKRGQAMGLNVYLQDVAGFAQENEGRFDVVCSFQVAEHLSMVQPFFREALTCIKPGGLLIISVPNNRRLQFFKPELRPLDCPPHHMSRWSSVQMEKMSQILGCDLLEIQFEPANLSRSRAMFRKIILEYRCVNNLMARVLGKILFSKWLYQIYHQVGMLDRWEWCGHSMIGIMRKPKKK